MYYIQTIQEPKGFLSASAAEKSDIRIEYCVHQRLVIPYLHTQSANHRPLPHANMADAEEIPTYISAQK